MSASRSHEMAVIGHRQKRFGTTRVPCRALSIGGESPCPRELGREDSETVDPSAARPSTSRDGCNRRCESPRSCRDRRERRLHQRHSLSKRPMLRSMCGKLMPGLSPQRRRNGCHDVERDARPGLVAWVRDAPCAVHFAPSESMNCASIPGANQRGENFEKVAHLSPLQMHEPRAAATPGYVSAREHIDDPSETLW